MYYYSTNVPKVGQILIGHLIKEKEGETCFYVRIPEYNNIEGMIPKSNLPKKRRTVLFEKRPQVGRVVLPLLLQVFPP